MSNEENPVPRKRRVTLRSEDPALVAIADLVRQARTEDRLTQEQLAELSGTGSRFVGDLELAKPTIELGLALRVLGALGFSLVPQRMNAFGSPTPKASGPRL